MASGMIKNVMVRDSIPAYLVNDIGLTEITINSGSSATFKMLGRGALIFAARGSDFYYLGLVNYWTDGAIKIASAGTEPTIAYTALAQSITITNNYANGITVTVIGVPRST